ncbi:MAG: hypothetical protein ACRCYV_01245 [Aeromonas sp.]
MKYLTAFPTGRSLAMASAIVLALCASPISWADSRTNDNDSHGYQGNDHSGGKHALGERARMQKDRSDSQDRAGNRGAEDRGPIAYDAAAPLPTDAPPAKVIELPQAPAAGAVAPAEVKTEPFIRYRDK